MAGPEVEHHRQGSVDRARRHHEASRHLAARPEPIAAPAENGAARKRKRNRAG